MVDFLRYKLIYFFISAAVIFLGLFSIIRWGYHLSIDFIGGTNLNYRLEKRVKLEEIKKILQEEKIEILEISLKDKILFMRTKAIDDKKEVSLRKNLEKKFSNKISLLRFETVGPIIGREMMIKTTIASVLAVFGILIYMTFAFKNFNFALAAILAMLHDFLVVAGSYSLLSHFFGAEIDTLFVTAILTTMSFSVHDTIVIFDKIREYLKEESRGEIEYFANKALTETMVRSVNNSMTIVFMLLSLTLFGGSTVRFFIITLLIGTITGTYSSPFVATPILVAFEKNKK